MTRTGTIPPASFLAFAIGPGLAALHEARIVSVGPAATLWPLVVIVMGAVLGTAVGLRLVRRGFRLSGAVLAAPNLLVLLFYGFLLAFFGLGGSR